MVRVGQTVVGETHMPDAGQLDLEASQIRNERTGIHARIALSAGGMLLAYSLFNVDRDEDRTRLANSAARKLGQEKIRGPQVKTRLDDFCARIWEIWCEGDVAEWVSGDKSQASWLLEPWIVDGGGTILFGDPKAGKSNIALLWALCVTHGTGPWVPARRATTLYVNLERSEVSLRRRIDRLATAIGVPDRLLLFNRKGQRLEDVQDAIATSVRNHQVELVILDSLSRAGTGNLNDNESANRAMDILNGTGCSWVAIGHVGHENKDRLFGSMMFAAAADLQVRLTSTRETDEDDDQPYALGVQLDPRNANDVRPHKPQVWALEFGAGNTGATGFRPGRPGEFVDLGTVNRSTRDVVWSYLREHGRGTAAGISEETGLERTRVAHVLSKGATAGDFVALGKDEVAVKGGRPATVYGLAARVQDAPGS